MKLLLLTLAALASQRVNAFAHSVSVGSPRLQSSLFSSTADIEKMLEKARKLKEEAAAAEQGLQETRLEKKKGSDADLDKCIDKLFPVNDDSVKGLAKRLTETHWSTDKLMKITRRLHEREIWAQGKGHVTASLNDRTKFESVSAGDPEELGRVQGLIDRLIEAAEAIDEEYMVEKRKSKEQSYLSHNDLDHWTVGDLAGNLRRQVGELRREHEEQFQDRLESFYEAQRKEKKHSAEKKP